MVATIAEQLVLWICRSRVINDDVGLLRFRPMVLTRAKEAFDHEDFVFELKYDGFRSLAYIEDGRCELVSRNNHTYKSYRAVNEWIGKHLRVKNAILDGELVCFGPDGKPQFNTLLYRRGDPCYVAFDLLWLDGKDLRDHSLADRKAVLQAILPRSGRIHYADHLDGHGKDLFEAACEADLEGVVAKWKWGVYQTDTDATSWAKIKNPAYSQSKGRHEQFTTFRRLTLRAAASA